ncbi:hypothetical protein E2C01_027125 [Portunus trituberculatus]|uniref:Uncharacterized protein n=1 Tax=Portunus trituberculatus TaxID=210409 RepID=A0A5B7EK19_PORTR|nr:hypothetical protein [Portunus trituberculatus]
MGVVVVVVVVVEGGSGSGGGDGGGGSGRRAPDGRQGCQPSRPARSQPSIPITPSGAPAGFSRRPNSSCRHATPGLTPRPGQAEPQHAHEVTHSIISRQETAHASPWPRRLASPHHASPTPCQPMPAALSHTTPYHTTPHHHHHHLLAPLGHQLHKTSAGSTGIPPPLVWCWPAGVLAAPRPSHTPARPSRGDNQEIE